MKFDNCISKGKLKSVYLKNGKAIKVFDKNTTSQMFSMKHSILRV